MTKLYKKLHRWPGLILSFFLFYYALSGIILNHRELLSSIDIKRSNLPANYEYHNWNNAALKGNIIINRDSVLIYGNIGIWLTDSLFKDFKPFYSGFPKGIDNRKIFDIHRTDDGHLYAAAFSGLYAYNKSLQKWERLNTGKKSGRFVGIDNVGDTLYAANRSYLFNGISDGVNTVLTRIELAPPVGYVNKVTWFQTLWQIHSGEIFGIPGKIYVDIIGVITIFLSISGMIWFFFPGWIKKRLKVKKKARTITRVGGWSLKWHNIVGSWTFILLVITFLTGMFLRPPLLIAIANAKVSPLKYSHLDQPNPWYDKFRDILYDGNTGRFLLSTSEGMYHMEREDLMLVKYEVQPPVSIMGINVFENSADSSYLTGSFSGIFSWSPEKRSVIDLHTGKPYAPVSIGRPVGEILVSGMIADCQGNRYVVEYNNGIIPFYHSYEFPQMPENILTASKMSLWSVCLEFHTGRIFQTIVSDFYILIVPLVGLTGIIIVISGYLLWRRKFRKK